MKFLYDEYEGTIAEDIAINLDAIQTEFEDGAITEEEYKELLNDIRTSIEVDKMSEDTVLASRLIKSIDLLLKVV